MIFDDEFLQELKHDPLTGAIRVCEVALSEAPGEPEGWTQGDFEILLKAYLIIDEMDNSKMFPFSLTVPNITGETFNTQCDLIASFLAGVVTAFKNRKNEILAEKLRSAIRGSLGVAFAYEFSRGDLERVQTLINELRDLIAASENLEADHQRRLLKRLEALQAELHKRMSDLDKCWGLIGEFGVILAKLGNDAKPIVDRIRELAEIVLATMGRAEELPSGIKLPQIGHDPASEGGDG